MSWRTGSHQKFSSKYFLVEKVLFLQNHFLENRFLPKNFGRNFFMDAKSFPRKQVSTKNSHQKFLVHNFYGGKIISSELNMNQISFGWKFFMVAKSFSRKQVLTKIFGNFFWPKFFMVAKLFPRKQISTKQNFSSKIIWSKIFSGCKIIYWKKYPKKFSKYFCRKFFMVAK